MRISDWSSDVCSSDLGKDPAKIAPWTCVPPAWLLLFWLAPRIARPVPHGGDKVDVIQQFRVVGAACVTRFAGRRYDTALEGPVGAAPAHPVAATPPTGLASPGPATAHRPRRPARYAGPTSPPAAPRPARTAGGHIGKAARREK